MQANDALPSTYFDSDFLTPADRFSAWRESVMPMFDVAPLPRSDEHAFQARAEMYQLGDIVAGHAGVESLGASVGSLTEMRAMQRAMLDWP